MATKKATTKKEVILCVCRGCDLPALEGSRFCGGIRTCLTPKSARYEDPVLTEEELKAKEGE